MLDADELIQWMIDTIEEDFKRIMPKVIEYGATDLEALGVTLAPHAGESEQIVAGCVFYLMGKAARASAACREDRTPSDDTMADMTIYSMMARFARAKGYWGVKIDGHPGSNTGTTGSR